MEQNDLLSNDLVINNHSQASLGASAKWGKFLSIVGFIFCGLMLVGGIYLQFVLSAFGLYGYGSYFAKYMGVFYLVFAIILFFPCLYLFKFSNNMLEALRSSNQENLDTAFHNLKSMFKFYGIFTIVILVIYALAFIGGMGSMFMR